MTDARTKTCTTCGQEKPFSDFYRRVAAKDGRQSKCKVCNRKVNRDWNQANPERLAERYRRWHDEHPGRKAEVIRLHKQRHPDKARAREMVNKAVGDGRLGKPSRCQDCGKRTTSRLLHGHHADYSKPLEVEWLCHTCHADRHRQPVAA